MVKHAAAAKAAIVRTWFHIVHIDRYVAQSWAPSKRA
jgi:hypothetical protein